MISYAGLLQKLDEQKLNKTTLAKQLGISSRTIAKIARGEKIANPVLERIASFLSCNIDDLYQVISNNVLLQILRDEKCARISGGLYHELQVRMTYNSNHIEGSCLSEEQTRAIFETNTIDAKEGVLVDDIIETINHFRAIDYVIDKAEETLNEEIIKNLHALLKAGTKDAALVLFSVGDYKTKPNMIGGKNTIAPKDVSAYISSLLLDYESLKRVSFDDIVAFHYEFEHIHPFQDGNGRVGRLIALKECLRHNITPFIIEDSKKMFYYRGLSQWEEDRAYLLDTCLDGQDTFKTLLVTFDISL